MPSRSAQNRRQLLGLAVLSVVTDPHVFGISIERTESSCRQKIGFYQRVTISTLDPEPVRDLTEKQLNGSKRSPIISDSSIQTYGEAGTRY